MPLVDELAAAEAGLHRDARTLDEEWAHDPPAGADSAAGVRGELAALQASIDQSDDEAGRLAARMTSIGRQVARLTSERERLQGIVTDTDEVTAALAGEEQLARDADAVAADQLEAAARARRQADAERHRWESRAETLGQALDQARAQAGAERLEEMAGFMGAVLELVEVDAGFEAAFEAGAGAALAAVVVDGVEAAKRALGQLQRADVPGAVVALPDLGSSGDGSTAEGPPSRPAEVPTAAASATWLRARVRSRLPSVGVWLDQLLAGIVVVDGDWQAAVDLAVSHPELVVVTRDGDRCDQGLWQLGAGSRGTTGAAVEEARERAVQAAARCEAAEDAWQDARDAASAARAQLDRAARAVEANSARHGAAADARQRVAAELAEAVSEQTVGSTQQVELAARQRARSIPSFRTRGPPPHARRGGRRPG